MPPSALPEVELEPGTLVIGDPHLDVSPRGSRHERFAAWAASLSRVPRLLVLGDLFDAWIGPAHARLPAAHAALQILGALCRRGCALDVVPGNRDFLLDRSFERATGARLHSDGMVGRLPGGGRALFVHGDELCTLDHSYQRMKRVLRSPPMLWLVPRLPGAATLWAARRLRSTSVRAVADKLPTQKEQQAEAVRELARRHGCQVLVCGHAHRFRAERLSGGPSWWVLDAFGHGSDILRVGAVGEFEARASGVGPSERPLGGL